MVLGASRILDALVVSGCRPGKYFIVFREKNYEATSFTVTLNEGTIPPPPPPPPPPPATGVYTFEVDSTSRFAISGGNAGSSQSHDTRTATVAFTQGGVTLQTSLFELTVCQRLAPRFPRTATLPLGTTATFPLGDFPLTRIRGASLVVRAHSFDATTNELRVSSECTWSYAGGGGGTETTDSVGRKVP